MDISKFYLYIVSNETDFEEYECQNCGNNTFSPSWEEGVEYTECKLCGTLHIWEGDAPPILPAGWVAINSE